MKKKHWYDYLWVYAIVYFALAFFNILSAAGSDRYGSLQASHMVCILSDGNHDAKYLQIKKQK